MALPLQLACNSDALVQVQLHAPARAALTLPELLAEVTVTGPAGTTIAAATLGLAETEARGTIGGLPTDLPLQAHITWHSSTVPIATSSSPLSFRVHSQQIANLRFESTHYTYHDDDGDGATNLHELLYALQQPAQGAGAANDPGRVPAGFYGSLQAAAATPPALVSLSLAPGLNGVYVTQDDINTPRENVVGYIQTSKMRRSAEFPRVPLPCPEPTPSPHVALFSTGTAFCCGNVVGLVYDPGESEEGARMFHMDLNAGDCSSISADTYGDRIVTVHPETQSIILSRRILPGPILKVMDTLDSLPLGSHSNVAQHIEALGHIIVPDAACACVRVFGFQGSGLQFDTHTIWDVLPGQLPNPHGIAMDKREQRLYVSTSSDHAIHVIDATGNTPEDWKEVGVIDIPPGDTALHAAPGQPGWVYAVGPTGVARIDTLTASLTWQQRFRSPEPQAGLSISIAEGTAAIGFPNAGSIVFLGPPRFVRDSLTEQSESTQPRQRTTLSLPFERTAGWLNASGPSPTTTDGPTAPSHHNADAATDIDTPRVHVHTWHLSGDPLPDQVLGIYFVATAPNAQASVRIANANGEVLNEARSATGGTGPSSTVLMLEHADMQTPPLSVIIEGATTWTPYDLVVRQFTDQQTADQEPNDTPSTAQVLSTREYEAVNGVIGEHALAAARSSSVDEADCYSVVGGPGTIFTLSTNVDATARLVIYSASGRLVGTGSTTLTPSSRHLYAAYDYLHYSFSSRVIACVEYVPPADGASEPVPYRLSVADFARPS